MFEASRSNDARFADLGRESMVTKGPITRNEAN